VRPTLISPLQDKDRGDCCNSQALVRLSKGRSILDFCGHHYRRHELALFISGWAVIEKREANG
jgi:hypothetical protein